MLFNTGRVLAALASVSVIAASRRERVNLEAAIIASHLSPTQVQIIATLLATVLCVLHCLGQASERVS
jgi:branched-subunit amino acid permease